ncbi:MAG TPA: serine hydrolase [Pyrinomonadaceae bacterium]|nr:serine hydrolase [Pyrinomonadaceae bacterium]
MLTQPAQATGATADPKSAAVDALFAALNQGAVPGAAVMVLQNGKVQFEKGYGLARVETSQSITPNTAFDLASVSKQFTAMAIMILSDRGKLSIDDPLTKFFPQFPAYASKIKVRNLLTHTSGLVDAINPRWFKPGYEPTSNELLKMMVSEPSNSFPAGEKFEYNNGGYVLLALIVEKVSGESFPKFMKENVFKPLGMDHTIIWDETKPKLNNLAPSYAPSGNSFKPIDYVSDVSLYGPKGVVTTLNDLAKWIVALEEGKLVSANTLQKAYVPFKLNDGTESPYGFGWALGKDNGLTMWEHAGGYLGYRAEIRRYPTEHTTMIVLSNNATVDVVPLAKKVAAIYLGDKMLAPVAFKVDPGLLATYVGKYEGDPAIVQNFIIEITLENGELYITSPIKPKTRLVPQSATDFQISETAATLAFNVNDQHKVTGLTLKTKRAIINARRLTP